MSKEELSSYLIDLLKDQVQYGKHISNLMHNVQIKTGEQKKDYDEYISKLAELISNSGDSEGKYTVNKTKLNMLLDFVRNYLKGEKQSKNASPGMGLVLSRSRAPEAEKRDKKSGLAEQKEKLKDSYLTILLQYVQDKIVEKFKTTSAAFRFFDIRG